MSEIFAVPKISSNSTVSALTFNTPLNYIQDALNALGQDAANKGGLIQYQVPVAINVTVGDLVYFNTTTAKFEKTLAALKVDTGLQGQALLEDSCHVLGLIISIDATQHSAVMLRSGYWLDYSNSAIIAHTIGVGAAPGLYYLSSSDSGKATKLPGWNAAIPCLNYYGNRQLSIIPFAGAHIGQGESILRNISTSTLLLEDRGYGYVTINQPEYSDSSVLLSDYAIAAISSKNKIKKSPIVSALLAGPGADIDYIRKGVWRISLSSLVGKPIPATDFQLRGTIRVNLGLLTYTVFPASAQTSMTMLLSVPASVAGASISSVKVWMTTRGPGVGTYDVQLYWIPFESSDSGTPTGPEAFGTTTISSLHSATDKLYYSESEEIHSDIQGPGTIVAKIITSGNQQDSYVHQAGFIFNALSALVVETPVDIPDSSEDSSDSLTKAKLILLLREILIYNPNFIE